MLSSRIGILAKVINKRWHSAGPKYDFLLNPTTPYPPSIKAPSKNKDYESHACCFALISCLQYQNLKSDKYSILIELEPSVLEPSTSISYFYAPTDSEYKSHKTRIENCLPIGFGLRFPLSGNPQL